MVRINALVVCIAQQHGAAERVCFSLKNDARNFEKSAHSSEKEKYSSVKLWQGQS